MTLLIIAACGTDSDDPSVLPVQTEPPSTEKIVLVGDSITQAWRIEEHLPDAINSGIGGQMSNQMLDRFDSVLSHKPTIVIILAGTNDIYGKPHPTVDDIAEMVSRVQSAGARAIVGTIPPIERWNQEVSKVISDPEVGKAEVARFNADIRILAATYGISVADYHTAFISVGVDMWSLLYDGIHPNDDGYEIMWKELNRVL
jgi:lysophospholipase L1-like esterase